MFALLLIPILLVFPFLVWALLKGTEDGKK